MFLGPKDPKDGGEEKVWKHQSWERGGVSGARETDHYRVYCPQHQQGVLRSGPRLQAGISQQSQGESADGKRVTSKETCHFMTGTQCGNILTFRVGAS